MISLFQEYRQIPKLSKIQLKNLKHTSITFLKEANKDICVRSQIFKKPMNYNNNFSYSSNFSSHNQSKNTINVSSSNSKILSIINDKKEKRNDGYFVKNCSKCDRNGGLIFSNKKETIKRINYKGINNQNNQNTKKQKLTAIIPQNTQMKKGYIDLKHFLLPKKQIQKNSTIWTSTINYKLMKKLFQLRIKKVNKIPHILKAVTITHEMNHSTLSSNSKKNL